MLSESRELPVRGGHTAIQAQKYHEEEEREFYAPKSQCTFY
jgi:hypothetical protein